MSTLNIFRGNGLTSPFATPDTGAYTLYGGTSGGNLLTLLDELLILKRCFAYNGSSTAFTDDSVAARLQTSAAFNMWPQPAVGDIIYFGLQRQFPKLALTLGTLGVLGGSGAMVWEYYNGSAWVTLVGATDGTSQLTASGALTFTPASQTGWAATAINGITAWWVRARCTGAYSTYPQLTWATITGWSRTWSGTNVACYQGSGGNKPNVLVQDDGFTWNTATPSAATYKEALCRGYGTVTLGSDPRSAGSTDPYPTVAQLAQGIQCRKSATADASTTARAYLIAADDRTFHVFIATGDATYGPWYPFSTGQIFSTQAGDLYGQSIIGQYAANTVTSNQFGSGVSVYISSQLGKYLQRAYTGATGSIGFNTGSDVQKDQSAYSTNGYAMRGIMPIPNGSDGGVYVIPISVTEQVSYNGRGQLRGLWACGQFLNDQDTIQGAGAYAGKSFLFLAGVNNGNAVNAGFLVETSDTWNTN